MPSERTCSVARGGDAWSPVDVATFTRDPSTLWGVFRVALVAMLVCVGCSRPKPKVITESAINVIGNALLSLVGEEVDDIARDCQAELRDETWAGQHLDFALRFDAEGRPATLRAGSEKLGRERGAAHRYAHRDDTAMFQCVRERVMRTLHLTAAVPRRDLLARIWFAGPVGPLPSPTAPRPTLTHRAARAVLVDASWRQCKRFDPGVPYPVLLTFVGEQQKLGRAHGIVQLSDEGRACLADAVRAVDIRGLLVGREYTVLTVPFFAQGEFIVAE